MIYSRALGSRSGVVALGVLGCRCRPCTSWTPRPPRPRSTGLLPPAPSPSLILKSAFYACFSPLDGELLGIFVDFFAYGRRQFLSPFQVINFVVLGAVCSLSLFLRYSFLILLLFPAIVALVLCRSAPCRSAPCRSAPCALITSFVSLVTIPDVCLVIWLSTLTVALARGSRPWLSPVAVARGCRPWLVARGCRPWLSPVAVARGCRLWLSPVAAALGCRPWLSPAALVLLVVRSRFYSAFALFALPSICALRFYSALLSLACCVARPWLTPCTRP